MLRLCIILIVFKKVKIFLNIYNFGSFFVVSEGHYCGVG